MAKVAGVAYHVIYCPTIVANGMKHFMKYWGMKLKLKGVKLKFLKVSHP